MYETLDKAEDLDEEIKFYDAIIKKERTLNEWYNKYFDIINLVKMKKYQNHQH